MLKLISNTSLLVLSLSKGSAVSFSLFSRRVSIKYKKTKCKIMELPIGTLLVSPTTCGRGIYPPQFVARLRRMGFSPCCHFCTAPISNPALYPLPSVLHPCHSCAGTEYIFEHFLFSNLRICLEFRTSIFGFFTPHQASIGRLCNLFAHAESYFFSLVFVFRDFDAFYSSGFSGNNGKFQIFVIEAFVGLRYIS